MSTEPNYAEMTFEHTHAGLLYARGNEQMLVIHRSVLLGEDDDIYRPVREHIEAHGLVLVSKQMQDIGGEVEASMWLTPQWRDLAYAEGKQGYVWGE